MKEISRNTDLLMRNKQNEMERNFYWGQFSFEKIYFITHIFF